MPDSSTTPLTDTNDDATDSPTSTTTADKPATVSSRMSNSAPRPAPVADKPKRLGTLSMALLLMLSLATGFLGGWLGAGNRAEADMDNTSVATQQRLAASEGQLISSIAKTVGPSVVSINVTSQTAATSDFFGFEVPSRPQVGAGTGIIISSDGLIVTNRHVIAAGATEVSVTLSDGTELDKVKVVGRTNDNDSLDVAFLKIEDREGNKLVPAEIGDSSKVQVGDTVVAIGNALGQFNNTVTSGIISGYGRSVQAGDRSGGDLENLNDLFQTDAAINQGNSGGPLVNTSGQVIGINTAVSGEGQNIGFAIPINDVNGLIKQVLSKGSFERSYLGVRYIPLTADIAKELELKVERGAYVAPPVEGGPPSIVADSPAAKAGLREKDIITAVDDTKIDQGKSLTSLVGRKSVGEKVKLTVLRDGKSVNLTATVGAAPKAEPPTL